MVHSAPGITILKIVGDKLEYLDNEAGGLRVQRVPPTEKNGRVHTSTVTVAVMNANPINNIVINEDDLDINWFSGTGPGGQNRNKVMASCRLRHKPSGITVTAQTRSRTNSLTQAMTELKQRLTTESNKRTLDTNREIRNQQIGSGQRGDKIRTIYMQRDLIVDHRTGKEMSAGMFLKGNIDQLWKE